MSQRAAKEQYETSAVRERLSRQLAYRKDAWVGQALYGGAEIEEIQELSEVVPLDEFFVFVEQV